MKAIVGLILALVLAVAAYLGYARYRIQQAISGPAKEIVSESMVKTGDIWDIQFVSKFDAPVDKVYAAFAQPEKAHEIAPEAFLKTELLKDENNTKLVEVVGKLDILPPGFKVQTLKVEYVYFPGENRITSKTLDSKLADITAEYKFEPTADGKGTILRFTEKSKDKGGIPIEDVQKGALREIYLTQVRVANRALGLTPAAAPAAADAN